MINNKLLKRILNENKDKRILVTLNNNDVFYAQLSMSNVEDDGIFVDKAVYVIINKTLIEKPVNLDSTYVPINSILFIQVIKDKESMDIFSSYDKYLQ